MNLMTNPARDILNEYATEEIKEEKVEYDFICTHEELLRFFETKVWQIDMIGFFKYHLDDILEWIGSPDGPEDVDLQHARGKIEQLRNFLTMEDYVLEAQKEQARDRMEEKDE